MGRYTDVQRKKAVTRLALKALGPLPTRMPDEPFEVFAKKCIAHWRAKATIYERFGETGAAEASRIDADRFEDRCREMKVPGFEAKPDDGEPVPA